MVRAYLPELMLVDVAMPTMNGYEVCENVKTDPLTQDIPIIMVTAKNEIEDVERAFDIGAMDYIRKPFDPRELIVRVRTALELKHSSDALHRWTRKMSRELELAGSFQRTLMSTAPFLTQEIEVRIAYRPSLDVGGDVFDIIPLSDGRICVYASDICGHGVAQAMLSSMVKATLAELIPNLAHAGVSAICAQLHRRFREQIEDPSLYATVFICILDPATNQAQCLNCGHPSPIRLGPDHEVQKDIFNEKGGFPIGLAVADDSPCSEEDKVDWEMVQGSSLFIYTDGLTEARHKDTNRECGKEKLIKFSEEVCKDDTITDPSSEVFEMIKRAGYRLDDDCTGVFIQLVDPESVVASEKIPCILSAIPDIAMKASQKLGGRAWPEKVVTLVELLIIEHCTNVLDHGAPPENSFINMQLRVSENICKLLFVDKGRKWGHERRLAQASFPRQESERGRGLTILKRIANFIEIHRRNNENIIFYTVPRNLAF